MSPSVRRAWIEIMMMAGMDEHTRSPSVRRAWIEILILSNFYDNSLVALREEGVD